MGCFSWMFADTNNEDNLMIGEKGYIPVPKEFHSEYGAVIYESCYDGYGHFSKYDAYELLALWNRGYLRSDMIRKPKRKSYHEKEFYEAAEKRYDASLKVLNAFNAGADASELLEDAKEAFYSNIKVEDVYRNIGILVGCYDEQNEALKYPLKVCMNSVAYESVGPSEGDPYQGFN